METTSGDELMKLRTALASIYTEHQDGGTEYSPPMNVKRPFVVGRLSLATRKILPCGVAGQMLKGANYGKPQLMWRLLASK